MDNLDNCMSCGLLIPYEDMYCDTCEVNFDFAEDDAERQYVCDAADVGLFD